MRRMVRDLAVAGLFLTRIPIRVAGIIDATDIGRSYWAFPIVGAGLGAIAGCVYWLCLMAGVPALAAAALALGGGAVLTGALHEDGLADCADALGVADRDRALEVLRDSRVGSFGALALVLTQVARIAALAALAGPVGLAACVAAAGASRGLAVGSVLILPAARQGPEAGVAAGTQASGPRAAWIALALSGGLVMAIALTLGAPHIAGLALASALLVGVPATALARRRFGGYTGDVIGALQQLTEIAMLLAFAAWFAA